MVRFSPGALLVALGVPGEVQKQLAPDEVAELHAFVESIVPMSARQKGQNLEQHMSEYGAEQIKAIQVPTLVVHARDDTLVAFEQSEFSSRNIPGARLLSMEGGGHLAMMLRRNAWARQQVRDFLEHHNHDEEIRM